MKYLAILGRQPEISLAELEAIFSNVKLLSSNLALFHSNSTPNISRLGGTLKLAVQLDQKPLDYLSSLPEGKITVGVSDYSRTASPKTASLEALKLKKILTRHGRSVRVVESRAATISTATSLHNGLAGKNPKKIELIKIDHGWFRVIGVQDIDAYAHRDQARPARDARVGMLPPKLAQILINLCGPLPEKSTILDPFCGTGVVLQEALLMGYCVCGTDLDNRMVTYTKRNLEWLSSGHRELSRTPSSEPRESGRRRERPENTPFQVSQGDATNHTWQNINAVACESYLGEPMSSIPTEIKLKGQKQICQTIVLGFLKNLAPQIAPNTPVTIAIPAWLRENNQYERLEIIDEIEKLGYNVNNKTRKGLLYHRESQIVARDIIILRKI